MGGNSSAPVDFDGIRDDLFNKETLIDKFGAANYVVFGAMLAVSVLIGVFFWYVSGTQYIVLAGSYPLVMGAAAHLYLPVFYQLQVTTSYEYLELRFNTAMRMVASACFTLQMVLYMAIVVYAPALALSQVTGFNVDVACAVIFIVCIIYCTIGGIKAVMWTDTFQAIVMFGSFIAIILKGNADAGGWSKVFDRNYQSGRIELFNFNPDMRERHTVWSLIIGGYFTWISVYGINQTQVQRYLSVPKMSMAVKAIWWNVLGIGALLVICGYGGLVIYAYYFNCDPLLTQQIKTKDQIFPLFVMQVMGDYPGIPGLFVAGVFSGALSTVSSGLNSLSAVCLKGFILAGCKIELDAKKESILTKVLSAGFGILAYGVVFLVKYLPGVLEAALGIFGIVGGPVLGAFTLGMFFPFANNTGALAGTLSSLMFTMWMGFGSTVANNLGCKDPIFSRKFPTSVEYCPITWINTTTNGGLPHDYEKTVTLTPPTSPCQDSGFNMLQLYQVSYMWYSAIACIWCLVVGSLVSLIKPTDHKKLDKRFISPGLPLLFSFWPPPVKDWIQKYYDEIGCERDERVEDRNERITNGNINLGYIVESKNAKSPQI